MECASQIEFKARHVLLAEKKTAKAHARAHASEGQLDHALTVANPTETGLGLAGALVAGRTGLPHHLVHGNRHLADSRLEPWAFEMGRATIDQLSETTVALPLAADGSLKQRLREIGAVPLPKGVRSEDMSVLVWTTRWRSL